MCYDNILTELMWNVCLIFTCNGSLKKNHMAIYICTGVVKLARQSNQKQNNHKYKKNTPNPKKKKKPQEKQPNNTPNHDVSIYMNAKAE